MSELRLENALIKPDVHVASSPLHGYGVYAARFFRIGEIIEECPVVHLKNWRDVSRYAFQWKEDGVFVRGNGAIYNHGPTPNVRFYPDYDRDVMIFEATANIFPGEELLTSYGKTWFKDRSLPMVFKKESYQRRLTDHLLGIFCFAIIIFVLFFT